MRYLARDADFAVKSPETIDVVGESLAQELERRRLTELEILGAVDLSHPPAANQSDDAISAGEHGAGNEPGVTEGVGGRRR